MISKDELEEWKRIAGEATPRPWVHDYDERHLLLVQSDKPIFETEVVINDDAATDANLDFITLAANNFLRLIEEVERLQEAVKFKQSLLGDPIEKNVIYKENERYWIPAEHLRKMSDMIKGYREALQWYADEKKYLLVREDSFEINFGTEPPQIIDTKDWGVYKSEAGEDAGERARKALEGK